MCLPNKTEDDWKALQETIYLNSVPRLVESIVGTNELIEERTIYHPNEEW